MRPPPRPPGGSRRSRGTPGRSPRGPPRAAPSRRRNMAVGADQQRGLALGVALADHVVDPRDGARVGARPGQQAMAGDDLVDRAGELGARLGEDHEVVADALDDRITVKPVSLTASMSALRN